MKILIGGSPCTHWSIAQTKNRETEASGIGWELFLNYRIARDKYQPDFFLYENNKSMSPAIRAQITAELGVEPVLINSALVSAQNRQRLYWAGKRNEDGELGTSQSRRIYSTDGKSVSLQARPNGGGADGAATGLYAVPVIPDGKGQFVIKAAGGKEIPVYEVRGGRITIKGKTYPIKLADGFYIIRKLTVTECKRLQTVPDTYAFPVSDTQAYKMLGNGWTVDVIAHIMSHFTGLTEEPVEVLSMYDGMSCGHIALDKLGAEITTYYATEIDKYAVQTTQHNYPDTMQLGDAFQVRAEDWRLPEPVGMEAPANG